MNEIKRRRNYNNFINNLNETKYQFIKEAAKEKNMSVPAYLESLIDKARYTSKTKDLVWEEHSRNNGEEFLMTNNSKLMFTIDWLSDSWCRDCKGTLVELRIYKFPQKFVTLIHFENSHSAMEYAQRYAELYDLEVEH